MEGVAELPELEDSLYELEAVFTDER